MKIKAKLEKDFNEKINRKFTLKTSTIDNISPSTEKQKHIVRSYESLTLLHRKGLYSLKY